MLADNIEDIGYDFPELRRRRFLIVNNTLNILLYGVAFVVNCSNLFIYFQSAGGASGDENFFLQNVIWFLCCSYIKNCNFRGTNLSLLFFVQQK